MRETFLQVRLKFTPKLMKKHLNDSNWSLNEDPARPGLLKSLKVMRRRDRIHHFLYEAEHG